MSDNQGAGRHAQTHDVRREQATNPTGADPVDSSFIEEMAPGTPPSGGHADESVNAASMKELHNQLNELTSDELSRLAVLETGARLDQGGVYLDLNDLSRGPVQAIGGQTAEQGQRLIAKRDTDYELWNRLAGRDDQPDIERPG